MNGLIDPLKLFTTSFVNSLDEKDLVNVSDTIMVHLRDTHALTSKQNFTLQENKNKVRRRLAEIREKRVEEARPHRYNILKRVLKEELGKAEYNALMVKFGQRVAKELGENEL